MNILEKLIYKLFDDYKPKDKKVEILKFKHYTMIIKSK